MNMPFIAADPSHDVCNARHHGLVGNGQTNDQPALAALVEKLGHAYARDGRPRVIYCPPGDYLIADQTTVWKSGVSLIGAAPGATRFILIGKQALSLARFTEAMDGASAQYPLVDCTFKLFEIDGSRVQMTEYQPRAKGLDLQYMLRSMVRDLYIHDTAATGLGCDHLQDSTIQGVIGGALDTISSAWSGTWDAAKDKFGEVWDWILDKFRTVLDGIKSAWNAVAGVLNGITFTFDGIDMPGPIPDVPGFTVDPIRDLPTFAKGVRNFGGGLALVGERGPELVNLPRGADVFSNRESRQILGAASGPTVTFGDIHIHGGGDPAEVRRQLDQWADELVRELRSA